MVLFTMMLVHVENWNFLQCGRIGKHSGYYHPLVMSGDALGESGVSGDEVADESHY